MGCLILPQIYSKDRRKNNLLVILDFLLIFCVVTIFFTGVYVYNQYQDCGMGYKVEVMDKITGEESFKCFDNKNAAIDYAKNKSGFNFGESYIKPDEHIVNYSGFDLNGSN